MAQASPKCVQTLQPYLLLKCLTQSILPVQIHMYISIKNRDTKDRTFGSPHNLGQQAIECSAIWWCNTKWHAYMCVWIMKLTRYKQSYVHAYIHLMTNDWAWRTTDSSLNSTSPEDYLGKERHKEWTVKINTIEEGWKPYLDLNKKNIYWCNCSRSDHSSASGKKAREETTYKVFKQKLDGFHLFVDFDLMSVVSLIG